MADSELYQQLAERHGHYCPMSTLGVRLGEAAQQQISLRPERDWQLRYLARTCAADGIRIVFEPANPAFDLQVEQQGQHCLQLSSAVESVYLQLTDQAMQLAASYRELPEEQQDERLELLRSAPISQLITLSEG